MIYLQATAAILLGKFPVGEQHLQSYPFGQRFNISPNYSKGEQKEGMSFYRSCPPGLLNSLIRVEFPEFALSRIRVRSQIV